MTSASALDEMLKDNNLVQGSLANRIDQAAVQGLITNGMKEWAHHVRLEANDQRHADVDAGLPTAEQAQVTLDFVRMIAEFLYVLPAKVSRLTTEAVAAKAKAKTP